MPPSQSFNPCPLATVGVRLGLGVHRPRFSCPPAVQNTTTTCPRQRCQPCPPGRTSCHYYCHNGGRLNQWAWVIILARLGRLQLASWGVRQVGVGWAGRQPLGHPPAPSPGLHQLSVLQLAVRQPTGIMAWYWHRHTANGSLSGMSQGGSWYYNKSLSGASQSAKGRKRHRKPETAQSCQAAFFFWEKAPTSQGVLLELAEGGRQAAGGHATHASCPSPKPCQHAKLACMSAHLKLSPTLLLPPPPPCFHLLIIFITSWHGRALHVYAAYR